MFLLSCWWICDASHVLVTLNLSQICSLPTIFVVFPFLEFWAIFVEFSFHNLAALFGWIFGADQCYDIWEDLLDGSGWICSDENWSNSVCSLHTVIVLKHQFSVFQRSNNSAPSCVGSPVQWRNINLFGLLSVSFWLGRFFFQISLQLCFLWKLILAALFCVCTFCTSALPELCMLCQTTGRQVSWFSASFLPPSLIFVKGPFLAAVANILVIIVAWFQIGCW